VEPDPVIAVLVPAALALIMFGLGLSLTVDDFARVVRYPRAAAVGLGCQILVLPLLALGIAHLFALSPELAVGLMVLAASPGGAGANVLSYLGGGDVALNITLTAVNSVLSLLTMPLIVGMALRHFLGGDRGIAMQPAEVIGVIVVVLVPVAIGMRIRARRPALADRMRRPAGALSALFLLFALASVIAQEGERLVDSARACGPAALALNLTSLAVGYGVTRLARLTPRQAVSISMEAGIHNIPLAMTIASNPRLLDNLTMAMPAMVYGVMMLVTGASVAALAARRLRAA